MACAGSSSPRRAALALAAARHRRQSTGLQRRLQPCPRVLDPELGAPGGVGPHAQHRRRQAQGAADQLVGLRAGGRLQGRGGWNLPGLSCILIQCGQAGWCEARASAAHRGEITPACLHPERRQVGLAGQVRRRLSGLLLLRARWQEQRGGAASCWGAGSPELGRYQGAPSCPWEASSRAGRRRAGGGMGWCGWLAGVPRRAGWLGAVPKLPTW